MDKVIKRPNAAMYVNNSDCINVLAEHKSEASSIISLYKLIGKESTLF